MTDMLGLNVLLPCLGGGVVFAALAVWLSTTRGNTISEILESQKFGNAEAIRMEILDKVKLSSNFPIVALYVVSAVVAVGLPAFASWQQRISEHDNLNQQVQTLNDDKEKLQKEIVQLKGGSVLDKSIRVTGRVKCSSPSASFQGLKFSPLSHVLLSDIDPSSGDFSFDLEYPTETISLKSDKYLPLTLTLNVNENADSIDVKYGNSNSTKIGVHNRTAMLEPISLSPIEVRP